MYLCVCATAHWLTSLHTHIHIHTYTHTCVKENISYAYFTFISLISPLICLFYALLQFFLTKCQTLIGVSTVQVRQRRSPLDMSNGWGFICMFATAPQLLQPVHARLGMASSMSVKISRRIVALAATYTYTHTHALCKYVPHLAVLPLLVQLAALAWLHLFMVT